MENRIGKADSSIQITNLALPELKKMKPNVTKQSFEDQPVPTNVPKNLQFINLKSRMDLIPQYVELRNQNADLLLTRAVRLEETIIWMNSDNHEIIAGISGDKLHGVAILYRQRKNEVAIFVGPKNQGIGTRLLKCIVVKASEFGLPAIWAWVLESNTIAQRAFEKAGFTMRRKTTRVFNGQRYRGLVFECVFGGSI